MRGRLGQGGSGESPGGESPLVSWPRGRDDLDPCLRCVRPVIVDQDDIATDPVEDARGNRGAIPTPAMNGEATAGELTCFKEQVVDRHVEGTVEVTACPLVVEADVDDGEVGHCGKVGEGDGRIATRPVIACDRSDGKHAASL